MNNSRNTRLDRALPLAWIVGGAGWTLNALIGLRAEPAAGGFYAAEVVWMGVHGLVLVGIVGLLRSGLTGRSR